MQGKRNFITMFICVLLFFSSSTTVFARSVEKQAVLAVLTFNVARFTRWPEQVFSGADPVFKLCVIGDNVVQKSFDKIDKKVINGKTIHVATLLRFVNLKQCQLLYVSELKRSKLIPLLAELEKQPILTVGENMEFLQAGGMVGFEQVDGKMRININLPIVKQSELVISSSLLKLAKIVDFSSSDD